MFPAASADSPVTVDQRPQTKFPTANTIQEAHNHSHHSPSASTAVIPFSSLSLPPLTCASSASSLSSCSSAGLFRRSFWNPRCSCIFSSLPDELLLFDVFSFLDCSGLSVLQSVCQRWRWLSGDKILWRRLDLSKSAQRLDDSAFLSLMNRFGGSLESIKMCNCSRLTQRSITAFRPVHKQLRSLHLCNLRLLTDSNLLELSASCPGLRDISLFGCLSVTDVGVRALTSACVELRELNLRGCTKLTSAALTTLGSELVGLNISGCRLMNDVAFIEISMRSKKLERLNAHGIEISDRGIDELTRHCTQLTSIQISSANPFGGSPLFTDIGLSYLARLKGLISINIQGSSNITDSEFSLLARHCNKLERLNIGGCYKITDSTLISLAHFAPALIELSIFQCFLVSDRGLKALIGKLNHLESIDCHSLFALNGSFLLDLISSNHNNNDNNNQFNSSLAIDSSDELEEKKNSPFRLPLLKSIDLGACKNIPKEIIQSIRMKRSNIKIIHY